MEPDDLYGLPLEEFTAARNELAKRQPELKRLRKPTVAAWAVNQLARRHRSELEAFLDAAARLRRAQLEGGDVAAATREERDALGRLLQLAGEYSGAGQAERVRQTLQAAAVDDEAAAQVRAGRLERELEPAGFGSLLTAAAARRAKPRRDPAREKRVAAAEAAEREAREALAAAVRAEREAHDAWDEARREAEQARRRADEAARHLRDARSG